MARNPRSAAADAAEDIIDEIDPKTKDDLNDQVAALRAEVTRILDTLSAMSKSGASAIKQGADAALHEGEQRFAEVRAKVENTRDDVADYARRKPAQAMGIAGFVGLLLGLALARR